MASGPVSVGTSAGGAARKDHPDRSERQRRGGELDARVDRGRFDAVGDFGGEVEEVEPDADDTAVLGGSESENKGRFCRSFTGGEKPVVMVVLGAASNRSIMV